MLDFSRDGSLGKNLGITSSPRIMYKYTKNSLIRPVLAYGSETWALTKSDKDILGVFERKILRAVLDPQMTTGNGE